MIRRRNLYLFAAALTWIAVSLACVGSNAATPPPAVISTMVAAPTSVVEVSTPVAVATAQPAIPEQRRLILEFPPQIRVGDSDVISLKLEVDKFGNLTPTAEIAGNVIKGDTVVIPNLYETHYVTAEARLDMAGMEVRPPDITSEPLLPGQSVTFYWSVRPNNGTGTYRGTAWLLLKFVDKVSGKEDEKPISAQRVEIESVNFLGLSANFARTAGALGSVVGGVIGFPFFADGIKFLWGRRRKKV
jgi:hypothetical protein